MEMAIQNMREVSCVEFEDISPFIKNYMKNYTIARNLRNYFELRNPPPDYPDFLL